MGEARGGRLINLPLRCPQLASQWERQRQAGEEEETQVDGREGDLLPCKVTNERRSETRCKQCRGEIKEATSEDKHANTFWVKLG